MPEFIKGSSKAFTQIFHHFYRPLCYFATQLIGDTDEADSIVQETFLKLWRKHADFPNTLNIKAFLYLSTRNACFNHLRHLQVMEASCKEMAWLEGDHAEELMLNKMIQSELMEEVYHAVELLPEKRREVFKLSYFEGLKNEEIAKSMRISIHTVKEHKYRAMYAIRCHFANYQLGIFILMALHFFRLIF